MAYIGNTVQNQGFTPAIDYFSGNGVTVTFTLSRPIASVAQVIVAIDNVIQNPSSAFNVAGNSITFTSAPLSGTNNIWVEYTSLITTYQGISQDPTVIGDIRATGGYLAEGDFGNSFVDGAILDYVTGAGRVTVGELDDLVFYHGGTAGRSEMMRLSYAGTNSNIVGNFGVGTASPSTRLDVNTGAGGTQNIATIRTANVQLKIGTTDIGNGEVYYNAFPSSNSSLTSAHIWQSGGTERMRIDSSGNVGIGTTSPDYKFQIEGVGTGVTSRMGITNTTTGSTLEVGSDGNGGFLATSGAYGTLFYTNGTERMRILSDGNIVIGRTSDAFGSVGMTLNRVGQGLFTFNATDSGGAGLYVNRLGVDGTVMQFYKATNPVGNIAVTGSATSYNTSSDYRLKENIAPMTGALATVAQLKPCTYTWKADGSDGQGFIAHELQEVVPDAVTGEKDGEQMQGVDTSFLVATLTAAIQEQQAMIEELKIKVAALEAK